METSAQSSSQPRTKRHYRDADKRRRIVEQTLAPGISVASVARAHGINDNQLYAWRKMYQAGLLGSTSSVPVREASPHQVRLLPVTVAGDAEPERPTCDAIVQAPAPSRPIDRGMAGPGLLAHVLTSKFADYVGMPIMW